MAELARLSLNTATVRLRWDLPACIEGCARHGIGWIGPWRDALADYGVARAARHLRDAGLSVSGLCRGGWWTARTLAEAIDDNRRAIDQAAAIGARCLVIVNGGLPEGSRDLAAARALCLEGLAAVLPHARAAGVPLALEPLHPMTCADRSVLATTAQALDWCDALGPGIGLALDVYHVWWDPALPAEIARARPHPRLPCLRLVARDARPAHRSRHDGRWRDRHRGPARRRGRSRLCRADRGRDLLLARLVDARSGRGVGRDEAAL
jgi:sugar phosphate isomerase/epimerase